MCTSVLYNTQECTQTTLPAGMLTVARPQPPSSYACICEHGHCYGKRESNAGTGGAVTRKALWLDTPLICRRGAIVSAEAASLEGARGLDILPR